MATIHLRSPLHLWHQTHGARLIENEGWEVPAAYSGMDQEIAAAKNGLALADISSFAKLALTGPGIANWTMPLVGDGPASKPMGTSRLDGGVLACRLTADHLLLLASSSALQLNRIGATLSVSALQSPVPLEKGTSVAGLGRSLTAVDQTSTLAGFALVGPGGAELLRHLTHLDFPPVDSCVQTKLAGVAALLVRVQELTVPSLRIYVTLDLGEYLWERLLEVGDVTPLGLDAWRSLLI